MDIKRFECDCTTPQHTLRICREFEDIDSQIAIDVALNQYYPWYNRIWIAIKYIFGYTMPSGHYDCIILNKDKQAELIDFLKGELND